MKRSLMVLLCMAVLLGNFGALAYADNEREEAAASSPQIITLSWLKEQTGKDDAWLNKQLDKGYTLYEIYKAVQSGSADSALADDLNAARVMVAEPAEDTGAAIAAEEAATAPAATEEASGGKVPVEKASGEEIPVEKGTSPVVGATEGNTSKEEALKEGMNVSNPPTDTVKEEAPIGDSVTDVVYSPQAGAGPLPGQSLAVLDAVYSPADLAGVTHSRLRDESGLYTQNYGDNGVSASAGSLFVQSTDFVLPGSLPFALTRVYDSGSAGGQPGVVQQADGTYINAASERRESASSGLGRGWSWDLPYIQEQDGQRYIYFPGTGTYELTEDNELAGYVWNDLKVSDDSSETVNGVNSAYLVQELNGYHYFLDGQGFLILITDNYGNRVEFSYTGAESDKKISSIRNNDGRELSFTYGSDRVTVQETGTEHVYTYVSVGAAEEKVLSQVMDPLSRSTRYSYNIITAPFHLVADAEGNLGDAGANTTALLTRIVRPTSSMTDIQYQSDVKQAGEYGTATVYKVSSRADLYSTTAGDRTLNQVNYTYSGEDLNSYGTDTGWTTTAAGAQVTETFRFEQTFAADNIPDRVYLSSYSQQGGSTSYKVNYTYAADAAWNLPVQIDETQSGNGASGGTLTTGYTYNEYGMPLSQTLSTGQRIEYAYEPSSGGHFWVLPERMTTKVSDSQSLATVNRYNTQGSLTDVSQYEGSGGGKLLSDVNYLYNSQGNMSGQQIKMDEFTTSYITNKFGSSYGSQLVTSQTLAEDVSYTYDYYPTGELKSKKDASGRVESYVYDALGRITNITHSDGTQTKVTYHDATNDVTMIGPDGIRTERLYNPLGQLVQEQTADAIYGYSYDEYGNLAESIDAEHAVTRYSYDAFGRQIKSSYPDGTSDSTVYDDAGRNVTYTDPAGNRQRQVADLLGQVTSIQEYRDGSFQPLESVTYNLAGMVTSRADGNGQRTSYQYDALGQVTSVTDPASQTTRYEYNLGGNLTMVTYADGQQSLYNYDDLGRRTYNRKASGTSTTNSYDTRGNVTSMYTSNSQNIRFEYNDDNMLTKMTGPDFTTSYTYDSAGHRTSMADAHGTTAYSYNEDNGFLTGLTYPDGTEISYTYNTQSRTGYTLTDPQGGSTTVQAELDSMNRVTEMEVSTGGGGMSLQAASGPLDRMTFDYTPNSLLKRQTNGSGLSTSFNYDGYDLSGVSVEQNGSALQQFGYEYDASKNMIERTQNGSTDQFGYDPLNRVASEMAAEESKIYNYDANGNRGRMGSGKIFGMKNAEYTYDSINRLTKVSGEGKEVTYSYNGDGLLYERTADGKTTRYYYDEEAKLMAEADVTGGTPTLTYVYIYDLSGQIWARQDKATDALQYYQLNGHGDVVGLNDSEGNVLNSYSYDIWGGPLTEQETVPNVLRYSGEYWDDTTGLQYLRARWYDPGVGRFMGEDTYQGEVVDPLSLNLYTYVGNNPLIYTDPSGHRHEMGAGWGGFAGNAYSATDPWKGWSGPVGSVANFLILDDINTLRDPNSSGLAKGLATAGFLPIGKVVKGGKLILKLKDKAGKVVEKEFKLVDDALDYAKACNCFTAGTKVQTDEGEKPIEEIVIGDKVLAKSDKDGEVAYKEVVGLFQKQADKIYYVHIGDEIIEVTGEHPFWLDGKGWTLVKDLNVGDLLVSSDGTKLAIDKIEKEPREATVYNFEVEDFNSYFVSNLGIWVHNCEILKANNMSEFFKLDFGTSLKNLSQKTSTVVKGATVYKVTRKTGNDYLKKGDQYYLDTLHHDHMEVFDSRGKVKAVLNLDGSFNAKKTEAALKEGRIIP
ncbi:polymorphic toxin-type HINT domain-containing protein [Paenibacillus medicaginis]|uniref:Polymorphic toxin-type HINT domain-containing protein n=1 Tax=Paenibacillus medicaginis TaxID=1470560 RepID=A0ABV5BZU7_9BACL